MKQYAFLDRSLSQVSQGETVYPVVDGLVTMPAEIAHDLVQSGQITLASNLLTKASTEPVEDTKPGVPETNDGEGDGEKVDGAAGEETAGEETEDEESQ